jgi:6-pyruvoyltetrahydropterin/6-carboxytetrahydropterin synthase
LKIGEIGFFTYHSASATFHEHDTCHTMLISRKIEIDYGHTLPNSFTFCNQLHGHRGVIVATVEGPVIDREGDAEQGMVMDFKFLRQIMDEHIHDMLDHGFAVWKEDKEDLDFILKRNTRVLVTDEPPTAEYLAKWAFNQIRNKLPEGVTLKNLRWYETPNNWADYTGE